MIPRKKCLTNFHSVIEFLNKKANIVSYWMEQEVVYEIGIKTLPADNCKSAKGWIHRMAGKLGRIWEDAFEENKRDTERACG